MKKILLTTEQLVGIKKAIESVKSQNEVSEIDVMYNNLIPDNVIVRFKEFYTHEDGIVATEVNYICVDKLGIQADCFTKYGVELYQMLKDYSVINLQSPLIQVI